MIRTIEKSASHEVQKVTKEADTVGYNVVPIGSVGDSSAIERFTHLFLARKAAGINTAPKGR